MSLRAIGQLSARRREGDGAESRGAAASGQDGPVPEALEAAIPTEVIALYTAVVAAAETERIDNPGALYPEFRFGVWLFGLVATVVIATGLIGRATGIGTSRALWAPETLTAALAFFAWGLVLPGSFLYVTLSPTVLQLTLGALVAGAAFLLGAVLRPILRARSRDQNPDAAGPPLTRNPPGSPDVQAPPDNE